MSAKSEQIFIFQNNFVNISVNTEYFVSKSQFTVSEILLFWRIICVLLMLKHVSVNITIGLMSMVMQKGDLTG